MKKNIPSLDQLKRVHIVGVCGTLMAPFAAYLKRRGVAVSGSDENVYPPMSDVLSQAGVQLFQGYRAENLAEVQPAPDLVVIGNVVRADNAEARAAIDGGLVYTSLPEAMEHLFLHSTRNVVVSGTHGKTTTSSMMAHVLNQCGRRPSYFIGGVSHDLPHSFHVESTDSGSFFVLEGDEYDTAFWDKVPKFNHYLPNDVILTSVEYDHADIYPTFESVIQAFEGLISRIRSGGHLIACVDYPVMKRLIEKTKVPVLTYGSHAVTMARFLPGEIRGGETGVEFDILDNGQKVDHLQLRMTGLHNILNALAVWIECRQLGLDADAVRGALASFQGVKRRQEVRGEVGGITVIDDFAHHPTAVRETLRGFRVKYPGRRLIAVFEPRSATARRKVFQRDFAKAFAEADATFIAKPYDQSRIPEDERFSSEAFLADVKRTGRDAFLIEGAEDGVPALVHYSRPGDVIAVLSNGGFGGFISKLLTAL